MNRDLAKTIDIPGELHATTTEHVVAAAQEIFDYDASVAKYQSVLNKKSAYFADDSSVVYDDPAFDPEADTVHNKPQTLSNEQKNQVKKNLGIITDKTSIEVLTENVTSVCSITGSDNTGKQEVIIYTNNSGSSKTITIPNTYNTPDGQQIILTCQNGCYCEVNYLNINGNIFARGL